MPRTKRPAPDASGHPEVATTAIHGPDGQRVDVDEPIPAAWPRDYVDHLVDTRAARTPGRGERPARRGDAHTVVDAEVSPQVQP